MALAGVGDGDRGADSAPPSPGTPRTGRPRPLAQSFAATALPRDRHLGGACVNQPGRPGRERRAGPGQLACGHPVDQPAHTATSATPPARHRDLRPRPVPARGGRRQQYIVPMAARRRAPAPDRRSRTAKPQPGPAEPSSYTTERAGIAPDTPGPTWSRREIARQADVVTDKRQPSRASGPGSPPRAPGTAGEVGTHGKRSKMLANLDSRRFG